MLTATRPYPGENYNEVLYNLFTTEPVPVDTLRPGMPAGLGEVVHRAMAREARNRFDSAAALADALVPYAGRPVTPLQSQVDIEVMPAAARPARATVKSPVSLTSMETTPRPIPVTTTPPRRATMDTDAVVRTVIPGRVRRMGIMLLVAAIMTGPLAYALWWYLSPGWRQSPGTAASAREPRAPAALQPPEKVAAMANPARAAAADAAPAVEPAPVAAAETPAERAKEPVRGQHSGHRSHAEQSPAQPAHDTPGVRPAAAESENPTQPPPAPAYPDTPKKRVRHFDDNPYGE
jgi:serine/threonine-protein kinase